MIRRGKWVAGLLAACAALPLAALAPLLEVTQVARSFSIPTASVHRGQVVRFTNADKFLHQIYVQSSSFSFSSDEQEPGKVVDVPFTKAGVFEVRCGIHPKMLLTVTVD